MGLFHVGKTLPVSHTRVAQGSVWDATKNVNHHRASTHRRSLACMGLERSRVAERNSQGLVPGWAGCCLNSPDDLRRIRDLRIPNPRVRYELPGDAEVGAAGPLDLTIRLLMILADEEEAGSSALLLRLKY